MQSLSLIASVLEQFATEIRHLQRTEDAVPVKFRLQRGLSLLELADLMKEMGCVTAYNLDGGGSSTMWFNGKVLNHPTTFGDTIAERNVSDIVYIGK